MVTDTDGR